MSANLSISDCRFCAIVAGTPASRLDSPWLSGEAYVALASLGAIIPGWSLVVPRSHCLNLDGHVHSADFNEFLKKAVNRVQEKYGPVAIFEHGSTAHDSVTSCGTSHAHMHLVPVDFNLVEVAKDFDRERTWYPCALSEIASVAQGREYLYMANTYSGAQTPGWISPLKVSCSQFFRKVISAHVGEGQLYDYKVYPRIEASLETARALSSDPKAECSA